MYKNVETILKKIYIVYITDEQLATLGLHPASVPYFLSGTCHNFKLLYTILALLSVFYFITFVVNKSSKNFQINLFNNLTAVEIENQ